MYSFDYIVRAGIGSLSLTTLKVCPGSERAPGRRYIRQLCSIHGSCMSGHNATGPFEVSAIRSVEMLTRSKRHSI